MGVLCVMLNFAYVLLKQFLSFVCEYSAGLSVAHLDAHLTGDQEVAGSTPAESATFVSGDCP